MNITVVMHLCSVGLVSVIDLSSAVYKLRVVKDSSPCDSKQDKCIKERMN